MYLVLSKLKHLRFSLWELDEGQGSGTWQNGVEIFVGSGEENVASLSESLEGKRSGGLNGRRKKRSKNC